MEDEDHATQQQQPPEDVNVPAGLVEEDSSDSSCMVVLKLPSVQKDAPASDEKIVSSRTPRKRKSKQVVVYDDSKTSKSGSRRKRARLDSEGHTFAMERAKEIQTNLPSEQPSFIKQMQSSHVVYKYVMGVPLEFRKSHLPTDDSEVIVEDESGESYKMKYISGMEGKFKGGWKKFSRAHKLTEGDVLVFHLLKSCHFKVYIIRANDATIVGNADVTNEGTKKRKKKRKCVASDKEGPVLSPQLDAVQESGKRTSSPSTPCAEPESDHSRSEEFQSPEAEAEAEAPLSSECEADVENTTNVADDKCKTSKRRTRGRKSSEADTIARNRAEQLQSNLSSEYPSFIRQMLRSNIYPKPIMLIPKEFCNAHLPKHDTEVTFEDENGELSVIKFLTNGRGKFLGGWKKFVETHKMLEGDFAVFQLLEPCYFKVYIIRINDSTAVVSANPTSSDVNAYEGGMEIICYAADDGMEITCHAADGDEDSGLAQQPDTVEESAKKSSSVSNPSPEPGSDHSITKELPSSSEAGPISLLSGRCADFEKFKIVVHGKIVDEELPRATRFDYYKLCCSRGAYLHEHFLKTVEPRMAAGFIKNMLQVSDLIRGCKLSTSQDEFEMWEKTLAAYKLLGFNVDFLLDRLRRLASFAAKFGEREEVKKYLEAKKERNEIRKKMQPMEEQLLKMKQDMEQIEDGMKTIKANIKKCKVTFQNEASAPW